ncbi:MAG: hypothetical protein Q8M86_06125 [Syntrophales bacterium]|nr:hypothetical protein [Syntrophales bacterium]MDP3097504.1 hypothetical protein [Syntrophales bacterium]
MKYGIPTSQGAGIFLWARRLGASFGPFHIVGNRAEGRQQSVEGETGWQSV